jgi:hypothetical protein
VALPIATEVIEQWYKISESEGSEQRGLRGGTAIYPLMIKEVEVEKLLKKFERYIVIGLLAMMALVVFLSTVELAVIIVERMLTGKPKLFLLDFS